MDLREERLRQNLHIRAQGHVCDRHRQLEREMATRGALSIDGFALVVSVLVAVPIGSLAPSLSSVEKERRKVFIRNILLDHNATLMELLE